MPIDRRQILAGLAVGVELDGDRLLAALLHHAELHPLQRRANRRQRSGAPLLRQLRDGNGLSATQVEARVGVGRVLDQDLAIRGAGRLVVVRLRPLMVRILETRLGGDHLAQIELDLLEETPLVEMRLEFFSLR